jgi:hypothetical protein
LKKLWFTADSISPSSIDWIASLDQIELIVLTVNVNEKRDKAESINLKPGAFANIKRVVLYNQGVSDDLLSVFAFAPKLESIYLKSTSCTDAGLEPFSKCDTLTSLEFGSNDHIRFSGLQYFTKCPITQISVGDCATKNVKIDFSALAEYRKLRVLNISGNVPKENYFELIQFVWKLPELRTLGIGDVRLSNDDIEKLKEMKHLEGLLISVTSPQQDKEIRMALPNCHIHSPFSGPSRGHR